MGPAKHNPKMVKGLVVFRNSPLGVSYQSKEVMNLFCFGHNFLHTLLNFAATAAPANPKIPLVTDFVSRGLFLR